MILSESEKNRIKGLYGLVTEADTAPPPDESVLVAKKNPFSNSKYNDFLQPYNSKMVDGDKFYVFNGFRNHYVKNTLFEDLEGKTFRYKDRIYTYTNGNNYMRDGVEITHISMDDDITKVLRNENVIESVTLEIPDYMGLIGMGSIYENEIRLDFNSNMWTGWEEDRYDGRGKLLKYKFDEWMTKLKDYLIPKVTQIFKESPDKNWELRQVKRKKTDF